MGPNVFLCVPLRFWFIGSLLHLGCSFCLNLVGFPFVLWQFTHPVAETKPITVADMNTAPHFRTGHTAGTVLAMADSGWSKSHFAQPFFLDCAV